MGKTLSIGPQYKKYNMAFWVHGYIQPGNEIVDWLLVEGMCVN